MGTRMQTRIKSIRMPTTKGGKTKAAKKTDATTADAAPTADNEVDLLVARGLCAVGDVEALSKELITAAGAADYDKVSKLLAQGADAKYVSDPPGTWGSCDTKSALHMALSYGAVSQPEAKKVVLGLVAAGANVNAQRRNYDWRGCGSSSTAFEMLLGSKLGSDPAILEAFLTAGADPNSKNVRNTHSMRTDGQTVLFPLHTAVRSGNTNVAGVLLRAGADVTARYTERYNNERGFNSNTSKTPLHIAIDCNSLDLVMLLLAEGADPSAKAKWLDQVDSGRVGTTDDPRAAGFESSVVCVPVQETALHRALLNGNADMVRALLAVGADQSIDREHGMQKESTGALAARLDQQNGKGDTLCEALKTTAGWTPENHKFFSKQLQEQVRTVLLVAKAAGWSLPDDALHKIFAALTVSGATPE